MDLTRQGIKKEFGICAGNNTMRTRTEGNKHKRNNNGVKHRERVGMFCGK